MKNKFGALFIVAGLLLTSCTTENNGKFTPIYKGTWNLINGTSVTFKSGDIITIAAPNRGVTAGDIHASDASCLVSTTSTFESGYDIISSLSDDALQLKVTRVLTSYKLSNSKGQFLGVDSNRNLLWDGGTQTWDIVVNSNTNYNANISSTDSSLGQLCFNSSSSINSFKMYTVTSGKNIVIPKIYKGTSPDPIYVSSVRISGTGSMYIGQQYQFSYTYSPDNANQLKTKWSSSNRSAATISDTGLVTATGEGKTTITVSLTGANNTTVSSSIEVNVSRISVTGVTISDTAKAVGVGRSFTLGAEVLPSNASNKTVTWKSSNTSVATVSSAGVVKGVGVGTATISVLTADGNFTASCTVTVSEQVLDEWTLMIYMCGADLESDNGLATSDIKEILSVSGQPDDVNIIIQTGGAKKWKTTYGISANYTQRWHVKDGKLVKDKDLTKVNMGLSTTFQSFLEWGLTEYPAEKTGVVLWNHGGAMRGACYDELFGDDSLSNSETKTALTNAFNTVGRDENLEFIGYDCCLMQVQDIAEFNSEFFNYMIASEESESGYGWDYDTFVDDLYALKPTETILKAIVDGFISDNGGASSSRGDQTLSYLDLSKMANYKAKWEAMAAALKNKITSSNASSFRSLVKSAKHFADTDYTYFGTFDAKDFLNKLQSNSTFNPGGSYISETLTAFSQLVKYSVAQKGAGNAYGLCMFFSTSSSAQKGTYYTASLTNFTNWRSIVSSYGA